LEQAVAVLQKQPGKMILMRPFERRPDALGDPFRLFEIYAGSEPQCAAAHYFVRPDGMVSIGCTPENIFELDGREVLFDVVAATRGVVADPARDRQWARELETDPKEIREHEMALARYRARLDALCVPGSVRLELHRDVRQLAAVRHLYSRLRGTLRRATTYHELMADSYPPLESYPKELIALADTVRAPLRYYGGMVGRVEAGGRAARCYLNLRTVLIKDGGLFLCGGVGVIAESVPHLELIEVNNKLRALAQAIAAWETEACAPLSPSKAR
jgi:anthranilate/para-aminobenzoate synthase component I